MTPLACRSLLPVDLATRHPPASGFCERPTARRGTLYLVASREHAASGSASKSKNLPLKVYPLLLALAISSCSRTRLEQWDTKTPDLPEVSTAQMKRVLPKGAITAPPKANDYQQDAAYLANLLAAHYPDKARNQLGADFEARSRQFVKDAAAIETDFDWRVRLQYYLATLKDGHSKVDVPFHEDDEPFYSLGTFERDSSTYVIVEIDSTLDRRLIGSTLLRVNGYGATEIYAAYNRFHSSEAPYYRRLQFDRFEALPSYWRALGLATGDSLRLTALDTLGDTLRATILPHAKWRGKAIEYAKARFPFANFQERAFFTQFLPEFSAGYLQMNTSLDYVAAGPAIKNYVGFPFRGVARGAMRRRAAEEGSQDFGAALATFFRKVAADSLERVILDLRYNPGGDERLARQFIWYITERDDLRQGETYYRLDGFLEDVAPGDYKAYQAAYAKTHGASPVPDQWVAANAEILRQGFWQGITAEGSRFRLDAGIPKFRGEVYVLVGPRTFSAAAIMAATLQDNGLATVVGTPTGNRPSGPSGTARVELPHTKTTVSLSYLYVERAAAGKSDLDAVYPDIFTPSTIESFQAGRDPALEVALGIGDELYPSYKG